jgi:hypothetical protein
MNQITEKKNAGALAVTFDMEADAHARSPEYFARRSCVTILKNFGTTISRGKQKRW